MTDTSRSISVAVIGGGMFFDDIIGQSFKDLMRGGIAGTLTSIGMSHLAVFEIDTPVSIMLTFFNAFFFCFYSNFFLFVYFFFEYFNVLLIHLNGG